MNLYRELINHFLLSLKGKNKFETIGSLLILTAIFTAILGLFFGIVHLINSNFYVSRWCTISISLFISSLCVIGLYISRIQNYKKDLQYHYDLEEKIRYFIILCKSKKIDEKLIVEEIKLSLDMLHDPKIKYYYENPIKTLNKKIDEIENNKIL